MSHGTDGGGEGKEVVLKRSLRKVVTTTNGISFDQGDGRVGRGGSSSWWKRGILRNYALLV